MNAWNPAQYEAIMAFRDGDDFIRLVRLRRVGPGQVQAFNAGTLSLTENVTIQQHGQYLTAVNGDTGEYKFFSLVDDVLVEEDPPVGYEDYNAVRLVQDLVRRDDSYLLRSTESGFAFYNLRTDVEVVIAAGEGISLPIIVWDGKAFTSDTFELPYVFDIDAASSNALEYLGGGTNPYQASFLSPAISADPLGVYQSVSVSGGGAMSAGVYTFDGAYISDEVSTPLAAVMPNYADMSSFDSSPVRVGSVFTQYNRNESAGGRRLVLLRNDGTEVFVSPSHDGSTINVLGAADFYGDPTWFGVTGGNGFSPWRTVGPDMAIGELYSSLVNPADDPVFDFIDTDLYGSGRVFSGPSEFVPPPILPFWTDFIRSRENRFAA